MGANVPAANIKPTRNNMIKVLPDSARQLSSAIASEMANRFKSSSDDALSKPSSMLNLAEAAISKSSSNQSVSAQNSNAASEYEETAASDVSDDEASTRTEPMPTITPGKVSGKRLTLMMFGEKSYDAQSDTTKPLSPPTSTPAPILQSLPSMPRRQHPLMRSFIATREGDIKIDTEKCEFYAEKSTSQKAFSGTPSTTGKSETIKDSTKLAPRKVSDFSPVEYKNPLKNSNSKSATDVSSLVIENVLGGSPWQRNRIGRNFEINETKTFPSSVSLISLNGSNVDSPIVDRKNSSRNITSSSNDGVNTTSLSQSEIPLQDQIENNRSISEDLIQTHVIDPISLNSRMKPSEDEQQLRSPGNVFLDQSMLRLMLNRWKDTKTGTDNETSSKHGVIQ